MKLIINNETKEKIEYKHRKIIDYNIIIADHKELGKDIHCINIDYTEEVVNFLLKYDDETDFYLIEDMLLINFNNEQQHYCLYNLPEFFLNLLKKTQCFHILISKDKEIEYHLSFDKIYGI